MLGLRQKISLLMLISVKLFALENVFAEEPPRIKASADERLIFFAQVNETIALHCPIESSPDFTIFIDWIKGNVSLYAEEGYEITKKGHLKIKSVAEKNAGIYTCEAVNGYGAVKVNLTLLVVNQELETSNYASSNRYSANRVHSSPPSIIKRPSSISAADVGGEATFHCISSGHPVPRIFWLKDGYLIPGSNSYISKRKIHSTLKLKGLKNSDTGNYKCIARNMRGEDHADFKLQVSETSPPPKIITLEPPNVTVQKGATIAFVCEVKSRPGPQVHIKWLKRQEDLDELPEPNDINLFRSGTQYYRPLNVTDNELILKGNLYMSKLFIRNSCEEDSGTYVCLALNDKGYNFRNTTLKVIGAPEKLASQSYFSVSSLQVAIITTIGFLVILVMIVVISHLCCKIKSEENSTSIPSVECGSLKHSMTSIRKPNKGDNIPYPEINDPPSTSKLLSIDSAYLYDQSESQISKTHTKNPFH